MFARLNHDIDCILTRDPAAKSRWEVLTCYPGLHALVMHRLAHAAWTRQWYWFGRFISNISRFLTGIEIHPGAQIAAGVFIDPGTARVRVKVCTPVGDCEILSFVWVAVVAHDTAGWITHGLSLRHDLIQHF